MQNFTMNRLISNDKSTAGRLMDPHGLQMASTVEDAHHDTKIFGKTRIPAGRYRLHIKPLGSSHFDARYGEIFKDLPHRGMIELIGVPGFEGVLIHCGNTDLDTEGCIIVGGEITIGSEGYQITPGTSQPTYRKLYPLLCAAIDVGESWITVIDEVNK